MLITLIYIYTVIYLSILFLLLLQFNIINKAVFQKTNNLIYQILYIKTFTPFKNYFFFIFLMLGGLPPFGFFIIKLNIFSFLLNKTFYINFFAYILLYFFNIIYYLQIFKFKGYKKEWFTFLKKINFKYKKTPNIFIFEKIYYFCYYITYLLLFFFFFLDFYIILLNLFFFVINRSYKK